MQLKPSSCICRHLFDSIQNFGTNPALGRPKQNGCRDYGLHMLLGEEEEIGKITDMR